MNARKRPAALTAVFVVLAAVAYTTSTAAAHDDPCHVKRTCPADDHSYLWSGMSCTSDMSDRLPEDQLRVVHDGRVYWCHVVTDLGMGGGTTPKAACSGDRAAVRTLTDPGAARVALKPVAATVTRLERLSAARSAGKQRRPGVERTVYRLHARLLAARLVRTEWELTIVDLRTGATVVAGFPADACTKSAPAPLRSRMAAARSALVRACGLEGRTGFTKLRGTATLVGVGFFPSARTSGATSARVELRPVLGLDASNCG